MTTRVVHKTRLEADSTTAGDVPASADLPAGYLDGAYVTVPALHKRFPNKRVITITVNGSTPGADAIDREAGDATPQGAARYVKNERRTGHWPTIYTPLSDLPAVLAACAKAGLAAPLVPIWTAHYTGKAHICGAECLKPYGLTPADVLVVATQFADPAHGTGGHFDLSLVAAHWPGVDPPIVTPLSRRSRRLSRRLRRRLQQRRHAVGIGRDELLALRGELDRVLSLKEAL